MGIAELYRSENIIRIIFFAMLAAAGALICNAAVRDFSNARASLSWPVVEAVILQSDGRSLRYAYSWKGRTYEAGRRRFVTAYGFDDILHGARRERPAAVGAFVAVRISPRRPQLTVLTPGGSRVTFAVIFGVGALFIFVGGGGPTRSLTASRPAPAGGYDLQEPSHQFYDE